MVFILPDEVLDALKCSSCKKYLSVKPVKIYPDNKIKCGRCSLPDDDGAVSLYGILAEDGLFKCVNRFDGCNELLTYPEVRAHEEACLSNSYLCPICGPPEEFATFLLPDHFQTQHPGAYLGKSEIAMDLSSMEIEREYFYRKYDRFFIINIKISQGDNIIGFSVAFVGNESAARKILHRVSLYSLVDRQIIRISGKLPCHALGQLESNTFEVKCSDIINGIVCKFDMDTSALANWIVLPKSLGTAQQNVDVPCTAQQLEEKLFPLPFLSEDFNIKYPNYFISDCGWFIKENKNGKATVVFPLFCFICHGKLVRVFTVVHKLKKISEYVCERCALVILELHAEKIVLKEDIFSGISLTCRWGCGLVNRVNHNCKNHLQRICPLMNCQQVGTLDELVAHFQERHKLSYKARALEFFSHELLESQTIICLILNRFVVLDVSVTNTSKLFTMSVIDKQYTFTRYTPVVIGVDFLKKKMFKHEHFFSINNPSVVFFRITLTK